MKMKHPIVCDNCGALEARIRKITRTYGSGASLLVIERIPVVSCSHCGESYLEPETVRAVERIKRNRRELAKRRSVPVASLS